MLLLREVLAELLLYVLVLRLPLKFPLLLLLVLRLLLLELLLLMRELCSPTVRSLRLLERLLLRPEDDERDAVERFPAK